MLSEAVAQAAHRHGHTPAVMVDGSGATWGEVHLASEALAAMLSARGIGAPQVVGLAMRPGPMWLVAATAVDRTGAAFAGLSPIATAPERAAMVKSIEPALVLAEPDLADGLPLRTQVVVLESDGAGLDSMGVTKAVAALGATGEAAAPGAVASHGRTDERRYAICFTSGTTGDPRPAEYRVGAARAVERIDLGSSAAQSGGSGFEMISSTQFAHVGFTLKVPWYARLGCTMHVMPRWRADDAIELVAGRHMATLGVVAPQLALILASDLLNERDLSALRLVIAGGAPSPPALIAEARSRLGVDYSIRYSSTESGGVGLSALVDDDNPDAVGTIGVPRPGVQARVAEPDGSPAPAGEVAELQILSPATMTGYLGAPEATAAAFTADGWLRTGDLALVREDGRFVLAGRGSDMYIRGGYNVHPEEVEAVLGTHPAVAAVAVAARPDDVMGEVGVAVVVPAAGSTPPTLEQLRAHAAGELARHKLPEGLVVASSLPLNDAEKLDRRRLAEMLGS
ncbi:MAG: acyl--CoA ligase [Actinomycetia bacterium]|nr:acyl--CoA ligase [Actinomycetes bacterium]